MPQSLAELLHFLHHCDWSQDLAQILVTSSNTIFPHAWERNVPWRNQMKTQSCHGNSLPWVRPCICTDELMVMKKITLCGWLEKKKFCMLYDTSVILVILWTLQWWKTSPFCTNSLLTEFAWHDSVGRKVVLGINLGLHSLATLSNTHQNWCGKCVGWQERCSAVLKEKFGSAWISWHKGPDSPAWAKSNLRRSCLNIVLITVQTSY